MITLLIVLLVLFGITLWLLSVPLECDIQLETIARQKFRVQFAWMYGIIKYSPTGNVQRRTGKSATKVKKNKKKKTSSHQRNTGDSKKGSRFIGGMLKSEGFIKRVVILIKDCFHVIEFRDSRLFCRFGLNNPADTGQCMGIIGPIFSLLQQGPLPDTRFEPDFEQEIFIIDAGTRIRVVPIRYFSVFLLFFLSPVFWRGIRSGIKESKS